MEFTIKLAELFDAIVGIIDSCFSFLPSWSFELAISGCALCGGFLIYKAIRG